MTLARVNPHCAYAKPGRWPVHVDATKSGLGSKITINGRFLGQPVTGVQRYARQIVEYLDQLLSSRHNAELVLPRGVPLSIDLEQIKVVRSRFGRGVAWEQAILPIWHSGPIINLCNTAPLLSRRAVVCIHDCNVFEASESYGLLFGAYYRRLLPLLARCGARIATVSKCSAVSISRHLGVKLREISVLPNGFEHALAWNPDRSALGPALDKEAQPFILLIGGLAKHKNAALVLGLSARLKELGIRIKVAGAVSAVFSHVSSSQDENIDFLGRVSDDDLAMLMSRALCLAFPSKQEGFGLPVLEAMARGCPVVASNRSSLPEICGTAALLADPEDGAAWLSHFRSLLSSTQMRSELVDRGHQRSRAFSWQQSAAGYLQMVEHNEG